MFDTDPKKKFEEDCREFDFSAALGQFIKDNLLFCLLVLAAGVGAAAFNGARGLLSNKKIGTIVLAIMVVRAYHAGTRQPTIIVVDKEKSDDNPPDPE